MKDMKTRSFKTLGGSLLIVIVCGFLQSAWAAEFTTITLEEALDLAFQQNTSHTLFLWEQELSEKRDLLDKHPKVTAHTDPAGIADGQFQGPSGSLTMTMPLGKNFDLTGKVAVALDANGVTVEPSGSLSLDYTFFALPERESGGLSAEEGRQTRANRLVLQTVDLLVQLRQQMDLRDYEQGRLNYIEASLEAARLTPNYDDLALRQKLRAQVATLALAMEKLDQLQLQLATILGVSEPVIYDPTFVLQDMNFNLVEEELQEELFASSAALRQARAELVRSQDKLAVERKTRGWNVEASGGLRSNEVRPGWTWDVGLSATKILYPRNIVLEELELAVAQAEYALEMQKSSSRGELRGAIQAVRATEDHLQLTMAHLAEARDDLDFRYRQYEAGLVTALQVQEATLALQKAEIDYEHGKMGLAQSFLSLWDLCGRDLRVLIFEVIE